MIAVSGKNNYLIDELNSHFEAITCSKYNRELRRSGELRLRRKVSETQYEQFKDFLDEEFADLKQLPSEYIWSMMCASGARCLGDMSWARTDDSYGGAAIWIADTLAKAGKTKELVEFLCDCGTEIFDPDEKSAGLQDSIHAAFVIRGLAYILRHRNDDCRGYKKNDAGMFVDKLTVSGKQNQKVPSRIRFTKLLELLPPEAIEEAVSVYHRNVQQIGKIMLKNMYPFLERLNKDLSRIKFLSGDIARAQKKKQETDDLFATAKKASKKKGHEITPELKESLRSIGEIPLNQTVSITKQPGPLWANGIEDTVRELDEITAEIEVLGAEVLVYFSQFAIDKGSRQPSILGDDIYLSGYDTDDPYAVLFATLYLADKNDLTPYSMPGTTLRYAAAAQMPWIYGMYESSENKDRVDDSAVPEEDRIKEEDLHEIYREFHSSILPNKYIPEGGEDLDRPSEMTISPAQLTFYVSGLVPPRDIDVLRPALQGLTTVEAVGESRGKAQTALLAGGVLKQRHVMLEEMHALTEVRSAEMDGDEKEALTQRLEEVEDRLRLQKKDNAELKASLHSMELAKKTAESERDSAVTQAERYRQELAEMRNVIYNMIAEHDGVVEEETGEESAEYELPYEVKARTVVYGGAVPWVRNIKQYLTGNIRFFDNGVKPNSDVVRNADVVWIQTYSISHGYYYAVNRYAENSENTELHLTPSHGVMACVKAIIDNDRNRRNS